MATVDRVLPWRRNSEQPTPEELGPVLSVYRRHHPKAPISTISRAYTVAAEAHRTQRRSSGESYINHPLAVARIVADIGLDETSIAAALLHDAVEDTELSLADLEAQFGSDVAQIVDGVTKLDRIQFDSREAQQAATMRKMLVAMAKDLTSFTYVSSSSCPSSPSLFAISLPALLAWSDLLLLLLLLSSEPNSSS